MMRWVAGGLLLACLGLTACRSSDEPTTTAPKPLDKMSKEEWCAFYAQYVAKPGIAEEIKQQDIKKMRERGCPSV